MLSFSFVNMYLHHLKFYIVCTNSRRYVCCSESYVVSNECGERTPALCNLSDCVDAHGGEVMYFWCFCFRGELGFLDCDNICMCVVNKHFEPVELIFNSVYVDLKYYEWTFSYLRHTRIPWLYLVLGSVCLFLGSVCLQ